VYIRLTLIYLHDIVKILNIPRKARGADRNSSRAASGPWAGLWGSLH